MKKVLGLDLGTTSIGWAMVNQAENNEEKSSIIRAGVRVNPLTTDEKDAFEKGKAVTTNTDRRLKRSMRRNLQRYKLRRNELVSILKELGWIGECGGGRTACGWNVRREVTVRKGEDSGTALLQPCQERKQGFARVLCVGSEIGVPQGLGDATTLLS